MHQDHEKGFSFVFLYGIKNSAKKKKTQQFFSFSNIQIYVHVY